MTTHGLSADNLVVNPVLVMSCQVVYNSNYNHNRSRIILTQLELSARQGRYRPHPGLRVFEAVLGSDYGAPADGPLLVLLS